MQWWLWASSGVLLIILELFSMTGMYLFILGISFILVGLLTWTRVFLSTNSQVIALGIISIGLIAIFRKPLQYFFNQTTLQTGSDISKQKVKINSDILPSASGKGELSGSTWIIQNNTGKLLPADSVHKVSKIEGLTLIIEE